MKVKLIKHEVIPDCGSYEVRFPDGRRSKYFYFENLPSRRLRPDLVEQAVAEQEAKAFARTEQNKLIDEASAARPYIACPPRLGSD